MRNGECIRRGRERGKKERSCHTSIGPTPAKKNLVGVNVSSAGVHMFAWQLPWMDQCLCTCANAGTLECFCAQMGGLPSSAPLISRSFIHLTAHLPVCLPSSAHAGMYNWAFKYFNGALTGKMTDSNTCVKMGTSCACLRMHTHTHTHSADPAAHRETDMVLLCSGAFSIFLNRLGKWWEPLPQ